MSLKKKSNKHFHHDTWNDVTEYKMFTYGIQEPMSILGH